MSVFPSRHKKINKIDTNFLHIAFSTRHPITFTQLLRRNYICAFYNDLYHHNLLLFCMNRSHENIKNVCEFAIFSVLLTKKKNIVCVYKKSARLHSQLTSSCSTLNGRSRLFFFIVDDKKNIRDSE